MRVGAFVYMVSIFEKKVCYFESAGVPSRFITFSFHFFTSLVGLIATGVGARGLAWPGDCLGANLFFIGLQTAAKSHKCP